MPTVQAAAGQVVEAGQHQRPAQPRPEVGVDGDDVDLAERRVVVGVDLRPAEPGQPAVALVEQEPLGVEPRLRLAGAERVQVPAPLLGVRLEGPVVHLQPGLLVLADPERARGRSIGVARRRGAAGGAAGAGPARGEPDRPAMASWAAVGSSPTSGRGRRLVAHQVEGGLEQLRADAPVS